MLKPLFISLALVLAASIASQAQQSTKTVDLSETAKSSLENTSKSETIKSTPQLSSHEVINPESSGNLTGAKRKPQLGTSEAIVEEEDN